MRAANISIQITDKVLNFSSFKMFFEVKNFIHIDNTIAHIAI